MTTSAPVTVLIPTVGRAELLEACLASLRSCAPAPAEILVIDQSTGPEVAVIVARAGLPARVIPSGPPSIGRALNAGFAAAVHDRVLVTHDDCRVREDWVEVGSRALEQDPERLVTGRVLPGGGDPRAVPSTILDEERREHRGPRAGHVLYPNDMAVSAAAVRALGGFDERFTTAAEDNDFCYRWLRAGRRILYEPHLVVWHLDWRTPAELERLYVRYWGAQGEYYAKHLRRGDLTMLRFLSWDLVGAARATGARLRGRPRWTDARRGVLAGLPAGLLRGFRTMR